MLVRPGFSQSLCYKAQPHPSFSTSLQLTALNTKECQPSMCLEAALRRGTGLFFFLLREEMEHLLSHWRPAKPVNNICT